jgi:hypothetical protein
VEQVAVGEVGAAVALPVRPKVAVAPAARAPFQLAFVTVTVPLATV